MNVYIKYLEDVLGVHEIMISQETRDQNEKNNKFFIDTGVYCPQEKSYFELIFLNILTQSKESIFNSEVAELFHKMRAAMKIDNLNVLTLDCVIEDRSFLPSELAKICEGKIVIVFSSFPKDLGELLIKGPGKWIETYSPAYLLEDPAAKKVVWNDLQKVMREFGG